MSADYIREAIVAGRSGGTIAVTVALQQAEEVKKRFRTAVETIRANSRFTDEAKRTYLAQAYLKARDELAPLRKEHQSETAAAREAALKTLFDGARHGIDSYRNALTVAAGAEDQADALQIMSRAHHAGDPALKQAMAQVSYERGWSKPLTVWAEAEGQDISRLVTSIPTASQRMGESSRLSVMKPSELTGLEGPKLKAAAEALPPHAF